MKTIDAAGKPCPIPVVEAKKALSAPDCGGVRVKVDNFVAVQNLEKMAKGHGYTFSYLEKAADSYEAAIVKTPGNHLPEQSAEAVKTPAPQNAPPSGFGVVISRNTMGEGAEELGKILIKGFIYSLTELAAPPSFVIFLNSGAYLTSRTSNSVEDLEKLAGQGTEILTCGTCVNYYGLKDSLAVGKVVNMYEITERVAAIGSVVNI